MRRRRRRTAGAQPAFLPFRGAHQTGIAACLPGRVAHGRVPACWRPTGPPATLFEDLTDEIEGLMAGRRRTCATRPFRRPTRACWAPSRPPTTWP